MIRRILSCFVCFCLLPFPQVQGQDLILPAPGTIVPLSLSTVKGDTDHAPILKGIKVYTDDPFRFDFVLSQSDSTSAVALANKDYLKEESSKLIKYFLAALTTPEKDMWVNLSPYEKDRIVPESFGQTEMGRDLLAQDYLLKQVTASLIYPEDIIGKKFWHKVYEATNKKYGNTNIPINTFNKVWIVPEKAVIYENHKTKTAYVVESSLKVLTEDDYYAGSKNNKSLSFPSASIGNPEKSVTRPPINTFGGDKIVSKIVRDVIIPQLTKEINEGENFLKLRQVYNSLILATWYKNKMKDSILSEIYIDKNKIAGVNIDDPQEKQRIYARYLEAFKKGAFNYIKEIEDPITKHLVPKKYFSGGVTFLNVSQAMVATKTKPVESPGLIAISLNLIKSPDMAQVSILINESSIDFDPKRQLLKVDGIDLVDIKHSDPHTLVFVYGQDHVIKVSLDPDEEIVDVYEKNISPKIQQRGSIVKDGVTYQYYVQDRIEGYALDRITSELQQPDVFDYDFANKIDKRQRTMLMIELIKKLIENKLALEDWGDRQLMIGRAASDKNQSIRAWLIDTDLLQHVDKSRDEMTKIYVNYLKEMPLNDIVVDNELIINALLGRVTSTTMDEPLKRTNSLKKPFQIQKIKTLNGGNILHSLDSVDLDRIINSSDEYFIQGVDHETHLQKGKKRWIDNDKDLDFLDNLFGIVEKIRTLKYRNPNKNIVVLDWGCGEGTGIIELKRLLEAEGINIQAYGLSHDYYPKWQFAPKGVSFILDSGENLPNYIKEGSIGIIFSTSGLSHHFTQFDSFNRGKIKSINVYLRQLIQMLQPNGLLLIDAHRYKKQELIFNIASVDFNVRKAIHSNGYYLEYQKDSAMNSYVQNAENDLQAEQKNALRISEILALVSTRERMEEGLKKLAGIIHEMDRRQFHIRKFKGSANALAKYRSDLAEQVRYRKINEVAYEKSRAIKNPREKYETAELLNRGLILFNQRIMLLQMIIAYKFFKDTPRNPSAGIASLNGALNSNARLHGELLGNLKRMMARHWFRIENYDLANYGIRRVGKKIYIKEGRIIKVSTQFHKAAVLFNQGKIKEAINVFKELRNTLEGEQYRTLSLFKDISAAIADVEGILISNLSQHGKRMPKDSQRQFQDLVDPYEKVFEDIELKVDKDIEFSSIQSALRHYVHFFDNAVDDQKAIAVQIKLLKLIKARLENGEIFEEDQNVLLDIQSWAAHGHVDEKKMAKTEITVAIEQIRLGVQRYSVAAEELRKAIKALEKRLLAIDGIISGHFRFYNVLFTQYQAETGKDFDSIWGNQAMSSTGGIDLNANKIKLEINDNGEKIHFSSSPELLEQYRDATGFIPIIINMQPLSNLAMFLGGAAEAK